MCHAAFVIVLVVKDTIGRHRVICTHQDFIDALSISVCGVYNVSGAILQYRLFAVVDVVRGRTIEYAHGTTAKRIVIELICVAVAAHRGEMRIVDVGVADVLIRREFVLTSIRD